MSRATSYLGTLGRLVPIKCPSRQSLAVDDGVVLEQTLEGKVKAQVRARRPRSWSVDISTATPSDMGSLFAFSSGEWGNGPFVWVTADAAVTNMLTPAQGSCDPSTLYTAGVTAAGPMNLGADGWAGRSFANPTPATAFYFGNIPIPVLPGQPVTASAYLLGAGSQVRLSWYDASGTFLSSVTSTATGNAASATRVSVTATPPATAASCYLTAVNTSQACRPALTWTGQLFEWSDGNGCTAAVVHGLSRAVVMATNDNPNYGRYANSSFTVTEVG